MTRAASAAALTKLGGGGSLPAKFWRSAPTLGPVIALVVLIVIFSALNSHFFSLGNVTNVLQQAAVLTVLALGETFVITMGSIDLSIGSTVSMVGMLAALLIRDHGEWAVLAAPLVGAAIGASTPLTAPIAAPTHGAASTAHSPWSERRSGRSMACSPPTPSCPRFSSRWACCSPLTA